MKTIMPRVRNKGLVLVDALMLTACILLTGAALVILSIIAA